jgi:hypothetical protein
LNQLSDRVSGVFLLMHLSREVVEKGIRKFLLVDPIPILILNGVEMWIDVLRPIQTQCCNRRGNQDYALKVLE